MARVTYIAHDGASQTLDVENGTSVMRAAVDNLVPGIDADCGGSCSCATCHVFVDDKWIDKLAAPSETELAMLDLSPERKPNSRLSCQIEVTDALDGLVVETPEFQF